jgi:hypothetical protein
MSICQIDMPRSIEMIGKFAFCKYSETATFIFAMAGQVREIHGFSRSKSLSGMESQL